MEKLMSTVQAAELLGISKHTLFKMRLESRIPYVKVGRRLMFSPSALEAWLAENSHPAGK
jgi:excisionase family DNA binding protein